MQAKMCDLNWEEIAYILKAYNREKITIFPQSISTELRIMTDENPKDLLYLEGWEYWNGYFTNKHRSETGVYEKFLVMKSDNTLWE